MACTVGCGFQPSYEQQLTNFTCDQLLEYCQAYDQWTMIEGRIVRTCNICLLLSGCGGFISYILMMIVFRLPEFNGASYIYHKAIVGMELVHMFVMGAVGWHRQFTFAPTFSYVVYYDLFRELWIFGDAMKLSASMVTTFLSMERFIAIWFPRSFTAINKPKIARAACILSFLIGLLHLSPPFAFDIVPQTGNGTDGLYKAVSKTGGLHIGGDEAVSTIIYGIKIITSIAMIVFCIGVAVGLVLKSKKTETMTSGAGSKWRENRRLSILQLVIAGMQIIDHIFWVVSFIIQDKQPWPLNLGADAIKDPGYTFDTAMYVLRYREVWRWVFASQEMSGQLDHATRLPIYIIGMKKFKEGFLGLFKTKVEDITKGSITQGVKTSAVASAPAPAAQ